MPSGKIKLNIAFNDQKRVYRKNDYALKNNRILNIQKRITLIRCHWVPVCRWTLNNAGKIHLQHSTIRDIYNKGSLQHLKIKFLKSYSYSMRSA